MKAAKEILPGNWFCPECLAWFDECQIPCTRCQKSATLPAWIYRRHQRQWEKKPQPPGGWYSQWEKDSEDKREEQGKHFHPDKLQPE